MTVEPLVRVHALYVPDSEWGSTPRWLPQNATDYEPGSGPRWSDDENGSSWQTDFGVAVMNGTVVWWPGWSAYVDGQPQSIAGQYCFAPTSDTDADGIPDVLDPYPSDSNNNTYYWSGGWWTISDGAQFFDGAYYAANAFSDSDGDGMPDNVDPYPSDPYNNNSPTYWWSGGNYTISDSSVYFPPATYTGTWNDSDGDGIPDAADPYPYDSNNGNSVPPETFTWVGGTYYVDGLAVDYPGGIYAGSWTDSDNDGIPDVIDPYVSDNTNNTAWWWGGDFMIDAQNVTAAGQWHRADQGDADTDGMPDDLDPYPNDPTNNTSYWAGGMYLVDGYMGWSDPQYYTGPALDEDNDGIPDIFDPYLHDATNNTSWWDGGTFLLNFEQSTFAGQYYAGTTADTDGDGIPDALDPYVNDAWNGTFYYWQGGTFIVDAISKTIAAGKYSGFWQDADEDGIPDVCDPYPNLANNNSSWWAGGAFRIDGNLQTLSGRFVRGDQMGDADGDGIPDGADPYVNDATNRSFSWTGGYYWVANHTMWFAAKYYGGNSADTDGDGIPEGADPYPGNNANGNTLQAFWWDGGIFTVASAPMTFAERFYEGVWADSDEDGIPDSVDPYPLDANNIPADSFYWGGGTFTIAGSSVHFAGAWYSGEWSDMDGDGIPDAADPYSMEATNGNPDYSGYAWWGGGFYYINGLAYTYSGQYVFTTQDSDGDGIPDALDPYPNDYENNSPLQWWPLASVTFQISNAPHTFEPTSYYGMLGDTDGDGIPDIADPMPTDKYNGNDFDGDHIPDAVEAWNGLNPRDPSDAATVRPDGLTNLQAFFSGLLNGNGDYISSNLDSDEDGMTDVFEITNLLMRFNPRDAADAPLGDLVFNVEKANGWWGVISAVTDRDQYYNLTGHYPDGLFVDPSKSVAENDWDNDGVSNVDELLLFKTDPRDMSSCPTEQQIRLALLEGKASLTTRANFLWAANPGTGLPADSPSGGPGGPSPTEHWNLDPIPPPPPPDPEDLEPGGDGPGGGGPIVCNCPMFGLSCNCAVLHSLCNGDGLHGNCQPLDACWCSCGIIGCQCGLPPESYYSCACGCFGTCCECGGTGSCAANPDPGHEEPEPELDNKDYSIPVDDASGAKYRKVALNGRPIADEKPQNSEETDQEKEETYVDAMTLNLRHAVTDLFFPIPGSDLTLSARRNATSAIWNLKSGLRPHERRDRPFGAGWTTSLAPTVEFIAAPGTPYTVLVTDEQGTTHRFAHWMYGPERRYAPWPTSFGENSDHMVKFEGDETGGTFTSRYGTKIVFVASQQWYSLPTDRLNGSEQYETHRYLRASTITDRMGKAVQFTYSGDTLTPDSIAPVTNPAQAIYIRHNDRGLVTGIWEPNGNKTEFNYGLLTYYLNGVKFQAPVLSQVRAADGAMTRYSYDLVYDTDLAQDPTKNFHIDLSAIHDPMGRSYRFEYAYDRSKLQYMADNYSGAYVPQRGLPRNVRRVLLPDGSKSEFINQSTLKLTYELTTENEIPLLKPKLTNDSIRQTAVHDAAHPVPGANGGVTPPPTTPQMIYNWSQPEVRVAASVNDLDPPKVAYFTRMKVTYPGVPRTVNTDPQNPVDAYEVYDFDINAGMSVKNATDLSGNTTTFVYGDQWNVAAHYRDIFPLDKGVNGFYPEPTQQIDALWHSNYFEYEPAWRIMRRSVDELGRVTENDVDAVGRRTKTTVRDQFGNEVQVSDFVYGNQSFPGVVTKQTVRSLAGDPSWARDMVKEFVLDDAGHVVREVVDPTGMHITTENTYDVNGNKRSSKNANGNVSSFVYDKRNRLTKVLYPDGTFKEIGYDLGSNKIREVDENGHVTEFDYDAMNRVVEQRRIMDEGEGDPIATKFTYDAVGNKLTAEDPNGNVTTTVYDLLQRPIEIWDAMENVTLLEYGVNSGGRAFDTSGFKQTKMTDAQEFVTATVNDALYRTTEVRTQYELGSNFGVPVSAECAVTKTDYDWVGNAVKVTEFKHEGDANGLETQNVYDALNRVVGTTFPDNTSNSVSHTATGLKWKVVDEIGRETETEYDRVGRAIKVKSPVLSGGARAVTESVYDGVGNIVAIINPLGKQTDILFDTRNRKVKEFGPAVMDAESGYTVRPLTITFYDGVGNVTSVIDPRGSVTTTEYDAANRKVRVTAPAIPVAGEEPLYKNPVTEMKYDRVGNVLEVIDAKKRSTVNTYDVLNCLKTTKDAAGITVSYDYDAVGNRTKVTDGKSQITSFGYDGLKRNTTTTNHLGFTTTLKYDGVNKTERVDADGNVTRYEYDNRHRLTGVKYLNAQGQVEETRSYIYDLAGHLVAVSEPAKGGKADVAYEYDELYRVTKETSGGVTHLYGYDLAGNRTSTVYGSRGLTLTSSYDALNRLMKMIETATAAIPRETTYEYDLSGNVLGKGLPNGDTIVTSYDALNRSIQIVGQKNAGTSLYHYVQSRDIVGNVVAIAEEMPAGANHVSSKYSILEYDGTDRLLREGVSSAGVQSETTYTYDTANNRVTRTKVAGGVVTNDIYVYDAGNRLSSATEQVGATTNTTTFEYNNAGSRTVRKVNGVVNATYGYDAEQRLVSLALDGHNYAYTYDYRTRRVERNEDTVATKVIFSGGTSVQEKLGGSTTVQYVRGSDWGGGVGGILYTLRGGTPSFTHYDSRGDVTTKTSSDGDVTYQASYEAFGTRTQEQGSTSDRQKANTKEEDPSGLLNEGMRYRDLETGTFITADPAGFVDGPNLYAYVRQNPWTKFDPEGLQIAVWGVMPPVGPVLRIGGDVGRVAVETAPRATVEQAVPRGVIPKPNPPGAIQPRPVEKQKPTETAKSADAKNGRILEIQDNFEPGSPQSQELYKFVGAWNVEIAKKGGSMTTRTPSAEERKAADAYNAKVRFENPEQYEGKAVGHIPDMVAGGTPRGTVMPIDPRVNSAVGSQVRIQHARSVGATGSGITYNGVVVVPKPQPPDVRPRILADGSRVYDG